MGVDRELPVRAAATGDTFPVRWSASLGLPSLDQLERRQRRPLWDTDGILLAHKWRFAGSGRAPEPIYPRPIVSCADYWQTDHALYRTASQSDHNLLAVFAAACTALRALGRAKPSRASFVAAFRLGAAAADFLPAAVALGRHPTERREIAEAGAAGLSWRQFHAARGSLLRAVRRAGDDDGGGIAEYDWTRGKSRLEILGHGDFNGDGAEDILLRVSQWPGYGHTAKSKVLLLTRHSPGVVMHTLAVP
jgi:hypothetical protein